MNDSLSTPPPLQTDDVTAFIDGKLRLAIFIYKATLSPDVTASVYGWIFKAFELLSIDDLRGSIYDFRSVTEFNPGNLSTVQRRSQNLNVNIDMSKHPVALIVSNMYQERMVRVSMKITPQEKRKKIVHGEQEALKFINGWNAKHQPQFKLADDLLSVWPEAPV